LAAADLADRFAARGPVLDVGSGTGALAAWVAARLKAELHLVDRDPAVRAVALRAFPDVHVHAELEEVGAAAAALVMGMEILEHIPPGEQLAFIRRLFARVEPGGLLVLSTPDESGYLGGWSGYAPHIGQVDARTLADLLRLATDSVEVRVWRMEGDAYHLGPLRRVAQPVANRVWTRVGPLLGPLAQRVAGPAATLADAARRHAGPQLSLRVRAIPADQGRGTGLVGVARAAL
jgi:SAM-dependent methyltransferase